MYKQNVDQGPGKQGANKRVVLVLVPLGTENSQSGYQNRVQSPNIEKRKTRKSKEIDTLCGGGDPKGNQSENYLFIWTPFARPPLSMLP